MAAQNASEAAFTYHQDFICSPVNVPWSHIEHSFAGPIRGIPYIILVDPYSKWIKVISIKSATIDTAGYSIFVAYKNLLCSAMLPSSI